MWADSGWGELLAWYFERGTRRVGICCIVVVVVVVAAAAANDWPATDCFTIQFSILRQILRYQNYISPAVRTRPHKLTTISYVLPLRHSCCYRLFSYADSSSNLALNRKCMFVYQRLLVVDVLCCLCSCLALCCETGTLRNGGGIELLLLLLVVVVVVVVVVVIVCFTLSQVTKALRESRGVALLYFRPLH